MKRNISMLLAVLMLVFSTALAKHPPTPTPPPDEGMWLPFMLKEMGYNAMKELGCELKVEEIYSESEGSVKDAIVQLGQFCTAEVISDKGLLLTNHHCAYDAIATLSTVEADYLTDGFWAKNNGEELHVPDLTVSFLKHSEDVTEKVLGANGEATEMEIQAKIGELEEEASEDGKYRVEVKPMYNGNEYYLFVYEVYRDIRLVGAPPSSIGKYGGDTDNWMWPRHTGDFSLLRVYAGSNNEPADYSEDNKPYKPKHHLPISVAGVQKDDFAMIMGYPGSTDRYLTAAELKFALENDNPAYVNLLGQKLEVMKEAMDADDYTRITLASNYASLSNTYKYFIGQTKMLKRYDVVGQKRNDERAFTQWVNGDNTRKEMYGSLLKDMDAALNAGKDANQFMNYLNLGIFQIDAVVYGIQYFRMHSTLESGGDASVSANMLKDGLDGHFEEYFMEVDKEVAARQLLSFYNDLPKAMHPDFLNDILNHKKAKKGSNAEEKIRMWVDYAYANSMVTNKGEAADFLEDPNLKDLEKDPLVNMVLGIIDAYRNQMGAAQGSGAQVEELRSLYMKGLREQNPSKNYYPDANFSMRLTYGTVIPYYPQDAVFYDFYTTAEGIMEKEDPKNDEFIVPQKLQDLISRKDYGDYARKDGELPVCFLTNNDITGGNSGSPVMNAKGQLIGCAFDGNWESMSSDIEVLPDINRTISVDIRYVLFIIDKFAGASHLLDEMTIVKE